MDWEHQLIKKIVETKELTPVIDAGISSEHFKEELHRDIFDYIIEEWAEHGYVTTPEVIHDNWPNYKLGDVDEPLSKCIEEVKWWHRRSLTILTIANASEAVKADDVEFAINALHSGLQIIEEETSVLVDEDLMSNWEERYDEYEFLADNDGKLLGMPTGFPSIDEATSGLQPEQFAVLIAVPKTGKSLFALRIGLAAHAQGAKVLFIGFEMSNREQRWRFDSMTTGIAYDDIIRGNLTAGQMKRLKNQMERYANDATSGFVLSSDIRSGTTVSGIQAKVEHYRPDLVIIDGMYFMDDETGEHPKGSPQALTNITRGTKRVAQRTKVPILGTTQALVWKSKGGLSMDSIGYTSSFAQDADIIMGIDRLSKEDNELLELSIIRARNTGSKKVTIYADWPTYQFRELSEEEMERMATADEWGDQD